MPKKSRPFIDKKKAIRFKVVYRSQHDPLVVDENAPQRVLKQIGLKESHEEQHKYGIYFDDDYNYLQHLKTVDRPDNVEDAKVTINDNDSDDDDQFQDCQSEIENDNDFGEPKLQLPSSLFASDFHEEVGMLNKAAPEYSLRLDLDPDIVAALDDDYDFNDPENILQDDFVQLANQGNVDENKYVQYDSGSENDDLGSLRSFDKEETKSHFTNYSMSSSCVPRNEQLSFIDEEFEKFFEKNDDNGLDDDDNLMVGYTVSEMEYLKKMAGDYFKSKVPLKVPECEFKEIVKSKILEYSDVDYEPQDSDQCTGSDEDDTDQWDCVSYLSTYSNIYNHPAVLNVPVQQKSNKAKCDSSDNGDNTNDDNDNSVRSEVMEKIKRLSLRPKNESKMDKILRKKHLKEVRRERRTQKKEQKMQFKELKADVVKNSRNIPLVRFDDNM